MQADIDSRVNHIKANHTEATREDLQWYIGLLRGQEESDKRLLQYYKESSSMLSALLFLAGLIIASLLFILFKVPGRPL